MNTPHIFPTAEAAASGCSDFILDELRLAVAERGVATLAVSGGRTPALLFETMSKAAFPWESLHFYFVDERCVPVSDPQSNYRLAQQHLLSKAPIPAANVHRVPGELEPSEAAALYSEDIRRTFHLGAGQLPSFDVLQHGMGPDGHTASLFPGELLIANRTDIAAAVVSYDKPPRDRITLLPGVFLAARSIVFLLDGADKQAALDEVIAGEINIPKYPAQLVARSGKKVDWFLAGLRWPSAS